MKRIFGRGTLPYLGELTDYRVINWDDPPSTPLKQEAGSCFFFDFFSFSTLHGRIFQLSLFTRKGNVLSSHEHHHRSKPQFWMPITSSIVNTSVATTILGQCKREVTTYSKKNPYLSGWWVFKWQLKFGMSGHVRVAKKQLIQLLEFSHLTI